MFDGFGGFSPFHFFGAIVSVVGAAVSVAIIAGVLVLLVRFLLIGTRAAEVYLAKNAPPKPPAPQHDGPDDSPAGAASPRTDARASRPSPTSLTPTAAAPSEAAPPAAAGPESAPAANETPAVSDTRPAVGVSTPADRAAGDRAAGDRVVAESGPASSAEPSRVSAVSVDPEDAPGSGADEDPTFAATPVPEAPVAPTRGSGSDSALAPKRTSTRSRTASSTPPSAEERASAIDRITSAGPSEPAPAARAPRRASSKAAPRSATGTPASGAAGSPAAGTPAKPRTPKTPPGPIDA